jgi:hypothetical protein
MATNTNLDPSAEEIARVLKHLGDTLSRFDSGFSSQAQSTINSLADANKALDDLEKSSDGLQKTQDGLNKDAKLSRNMFGENSKALGNLKNKLQDGAAHLKNLGKQIEDAEAGYAKLAANAAPQERDAAKRRLNDARAAHDAATAAHDVLERRVQGIDKVAGALPGSIGAVAKSFASAAEQIISVETALLSGGDAVTFASNVLKIGIDDAAAGLKNVGTVADGLGSILMSTPNPYAIAGGVIIKAAGGIATAFAEASQAVKAGISLLEQEINKTATAYHSMSSVGANFATGMGEMRAAAGEAVLPLADFSRIITANAQTLADAGLGMAGAAKKFAQISKSMSDSGLREKLFELGYNLEEVGGVTADVMANLNTANKLQGKSDAEIGQITYEYAKNLRLISDITGQDARKKMDQARKESLRAGIYDNIMAEAGQEGVDKFREASVAMSDEFKSMVAGLVASKGRAFGSAELNILAEQVPEIAIAVRETYQDIMNPAIDSVDAQLRVLERATKIGTAVKKPNEVLGAMGSAQTLGGRPITGVDTFNAARDFYLSLAGLNVEEAREKLNAEKDALTKENAKLQEAQARAIARGEAIATPALAGFAGILTTTTKTVDLFGEAIEKAMKALGSYKTPGTVPTPVSGPVTLSGGQTVTVNDGGLFPEFSKWLSEHGLRAMGSGKPKFASGGITDGVSIAGERGPEAVVPLPDGRTIPVNIQSIDSNYGGSSSSSNNTMSKVFQELSEFFRNQNTTMQTNTGTLENILAVLRDSYDTQDRLLANSY